MRYVPRHSWQDPAYPVTGSVAVAEEWRWNTLHYCGVDVDVSNPIRLLRNMQRAWVDSKGYSLGYNFAVFDIGVYEVRGFDIRCAANGSQEVNRPAVAILLAVPAIDGTPTDAMIQGVRDVVAQTRALVPQTLTVNGHRDVRPQPTACCGNIIMGMIAAGTFEPIQSPLEEDGMIFKCTDTGDAIYAQSTDMNVRHVTAQEGAVAEAGQPGWADSAPTLSLPGDVVAWLKTL